MAPWEGLGDYYRESICRGGIPDHAFWDVLFSWACGIVDKHLSRSLICLLIWCEGTKQTQRDVAAMVEKHGLFNDYWEDKKPRLRNINVPMYATASYSTGLHTEGSLRGFMFSASTEKWSVLIQAALQPQLIHPGYDGLPPKNGMTSTKKRTSTTSRKFFDKYMRDSDTGWEQTPQVPLVTPRIQSSFGHRPSRNFVPTSLFQGKRPSIWMQKALSSQNTPKAGTTCHSYQADSADDEGLFLLPRIRLLYRALRNLQSQAFPMSTTEHDDMVSEVFLPKKPY